MGGAVKGRWNIVLSGYPESGQTMLANRLVANPLLARVGVDELHLMLFNEAYPSRDEFLIYYTIADMRDSLLKRGYSVVGKVYKVPTLLRLISKSISEVM